MQNSTHGALTQIQTELLRTQDGPNMLLSTVMLVRMSRISHIKPILLIREVEKRNKRTSENYRELLHDTVTVAKIDLKGIDFCRNLNMLKDHK